MVVVVSAKGVAHFYEEGIRLFNDSRFFECHEAWEEAWKRSDGVEKLFYQGLIQAAVAILHAQRGNRAGAESLYARARAKLDRLPAEYMGIELASFRIELADFFAAFLSKRQERPGPPKLRPLGNSLTRR